MPAPLEDVRILAVEQYGAGPWATLQLSDLGAEVIKIEDPSSGGDVGRYVPPLLVEEDSIFFQAFNRGKSSIALDLENTAGRSIFERLVRISDVVFSNLRGDVPQRLGLTFSSLSNINPQIVCCSLSAFGMTGARRSLPGYDYILQGMTGWMSLTGEPDGPPAKSGLSMVDYSAGFVAAISILAGVQQARRTGHGMDCDVSLFDTAISLLTYIGGWTLSGGYQVGRKAKSAHPSLFPFQAFETSDGWVVIACAKNKFWYKLIRALHLEEELGDERYDTFEGRLEHVEYLSGALQARLLTKTSEEWVRLLESHGVPVGPVNDVADALADKAVAERDLTRSMTHPSLGEVRVLDTAARVGTYRSKPKLAPALAGDTHRVLNELLGCTDSEVGDLTKRGALGQDKK